VALVHDWLTGMRGGERVLEVLASLLPGAHLFTLFRVPGSVSPALEALPTTTSFLQHLPLLERGYRYYLPLFPRAIRSLDLRGYSLVVSSSHCVAKGVAVDLGAVHLCYCHTPMRYAWDRFDDYFGTAGGSRVPRPLARSVLSRLRRWDVATSAGVTRYLANSRHVAGRIARCYGRTARVIPPPVDTDAFHPVSDTPRDEYLMVSALVPYKRIDRALEAMQRSGRRLRIVGEGPERSRLERLAGGSATFLGRLPESDLVREYSRCRALLMPGVEDAGIAPLEAMACGRPVIALNAGGVPEVVVPPGNGKAPTGLLFDEPTAAGLARALERFESLQAGFDPVAIRRHAQLYDEAVFRERLQEAIREAFAAEPGQEVAS
jgi:glycosyltransferase involved in cell wall biosynthesis